MKSINSTFCNELDEFSQDYLNELENLNKSKNTILSYGSTINSFIKFLNQYGKKINFGTITPNLLNKFLIYKNNISNQHKEIEPSSKKLYLEHLKFFFLFIEEESTELLDFSKVFKSPRLKLSIPKRLPKGLENNEIKIIISYLENKIIKSKTSTKNKQFVAVRNSLITKIFLYSGPRVSELIQIKISNFIKEDNIIKIPIIGKGDKEDYIYILNNLIENELNFFNDNNIDLIALTIQNKSMDRTQIWLMLSRIFKDCKINKSGVHILRHTFAKKLYSETKDIITVKEMLRHSSVQTTQIYATHGENTLKINYEKAIKKGYL